LKCACERSETEQRRDVLRFDLQRQLELADRRGEITEPRVGRTQVHVDQGLLRRRLRCGEKLGQRALVEPLLE
jgi:hypothetical protein